MYIRAGKRRHRRKKGMQLQPLIQRSMDVPHHTQKGKKKVTVLFGQIYIDKLKPCSSSVQGLYPRRCHAPICDCRLGYGVLTCQRQQPLVAHASVTTC